jgi:hypothetical protein
MMESPPKMEAVFPQFLLYPVFLDEEIILDTSSQDNCIFETRVVSRPKSPNQTKRQGQEMGRLQEHRDHGSRNRGVDLAVP